MLWSPGNKVLSEGGFVAELSHVHLIRDGVTRSDR